MSLERAQAVVNDVDTAYLVDGPTDGPLAVCLHGFPDSAHTWRHLLPALAGAGYRAVAPWMRGYAPTAVPDDGLYQTGALVADVCALHETLGGDERAVIIGHDWGAIATYGAAAFAPERWAKVVGMAVPPAGAMAKMFTSYDQLRRSWYMFFFQSPLADLAVPADDFRFIERLWQDWSPGYDGSEDIVHVKDSLRHPASLQAAIGYYRATFNPQHNDPALAAEQAAGMAPGPQPLLYFHGMNDGCAGIELIDGVGAALPEGSDVVVVADAGHFVHLEQPAEVNARILSFLAG